MIALVVIVAWLAVAFVTVAFVGIAGATDRRDGRK